ncbi:MAG: extracellular solute-binding protein, partial [Candidatus Dormiibacterota bacterium]
MTADRLTRRSFLVGATGVAAGAGLLPLLDACGGGSQSGNSGGGGNGGNGGGKIGGSLDVWGIVSFTPAGDALLGQQMKDWGTKNGVSVTYTAVPGTDYETKVGAAIQSGGLPDVVMLESTDPIYYGSQGHIIDITDVYDEVKGLGGGIYDAVMPYSTLNGKVVAIPMQVAPTLLYARLDMCEKATGQRQPPQTLDELESIAEKVNDPPNFYSIALTLGKTADSGDVAGLMTAEGGTYVDKHGNPAIDNPGMVAALTRIKRWWDKKLINPSALTANDSWNNDLYQSGQTAFAWNPASIYSYLATSNQALLKNTSQGPAPKQKVSAQAASPWQWSISSTSKNQTSAKALLKYIMQPDQLEAVYEKVDGRWYPIYKELASRPFWKDNPYFAAFPDLIAHNQTDWYPATASSKLLAQLNAFETAYIIAQETQTVLL